MICLHFHVMYQLCLIGRADVFNHRAENTYQMSLWSLSVFLMRHIFHYVIANNNIIETVMYELLCKEKKSLTKSPLAV